MNFKILILICLTICSCDEHKKTNADPQVISEQAPTFPRTKIPEIHKFFNKFIKENDEKEYNNLCVESILSGKLEDLLYYSIAMANRNNTPCAYYYTYYALSHPRNGVWIDKSDNKTKNISLFYLLKSYELGYVKAKPDIDRFFGKNKKIQESNYYLMEYYK